MNIYRKVFEAGDFDLRQFRPYFIDDKAFVSEVQMLNGKPIFANKEVPVECCRLTMEQWCKIDAMCTTVVQSKLKLVRELQQKGLLFGRDKADSVECENCIFIHKDYEGTNTLFLQDCVTAVVETMERFVDAVRKWNESQKIYLVTDVTTIQATPIHCLSESYNNSPVMKVICAFYLPGVKKDVWSNLIKLN